MSEKKQDRENITLEVSQKLLNEIKSGDVEHGVSVTNMLLSEGPNISPDLLIVIVESILHISVKAGSADAKDYLESKWPTLKVAHLKRLKRKFRLQEQN